MKQENNMETHMETQLAEAKKQVVSAVSASVELSRQMEALRLQFNTPPSDCPICSGPVIEGQCEECGGYQHLPTINKNLRTALASAEAGRDEARKKQPINTSLRLFDLVRYLRSDLLHAELITEEEYGWLAFESPMATSPKGGSPSRERLEEYDQLRATVATLTKAGDQLAAALHGRAQPTPALAAWEESTKASR